MRYLILSIFSLLFVNICFAQHENWVIKTLPEPGNIGKSYKDFIPKGYEVLATAKGDLNRDGTEDMVLVLRENTEKHIDYIDDTNFNSQYRPLIVLFKTKEGWKLGAKTQNVVMCKDCGGFPGDPFKNVSIKNNVLSVTQRGGNAKKWANIRKYQYVGHDFYLVGKTDIDITETEYCENKLIPPGTYTDVNFITHHKQVKKVLKNCKEVVLCSEKLHSAPLEKMNEYLDI